LHDFRLPGKRSRNLPGKLRLMHAFHAAEAAKGHKHMDEG
jgi:hypothetical protein